jgi:3',5'-cyclic AMP phosphodiesterase CpdA
MFVLAHLSDPHLGPLPAARLSELAGKRAVGFTNWHRRRVLLHRPDVVAEIVRDLKAQGPSHIAVTGDLVNIALPGEFAPARAWLDSLGPPHDVTFVPGNHDAYIRATVDHSELHWSDYMRGDGVNDRTTFPALRRRGNVALVGLSTAVPTAPFMATGRLGARQLTGLADTLRELGREKLFRVVLIHHPPRSAPGRRFKRLIDGRAFREVLAQYGAELVLHGHDHVQALVWHDGPNGPIPAVGVPSASASLDSQEDAAAYNLYRIDGGPGSWRCEMISRGLSPDGIVELRRETLA